jgi:hypothetical protein
MQCAKLVSNSGVSRVVMRILSRAKHRQPEIVLEYYRKCNIEVTILEDKIDR